MVTFAVAMTLLFWLLRSTTVPPISILSKMPQFTETVRMFCPNAVPSWNRSTRVVVEVGTVISPVGPSKVLTRIAGFSSRGST
jgi:hypothetical protein